MKLPRGDRYSWNKNVVPVYNRDGVMVKKVTKSMTSVGASKYARTPVKFEKVNDVWSWVPVADCEWRNRLTSP